MINACCGGLRHILRKSSPRPWLCRTASSQSTISPSFLQRARTIADEHARLSAKLAGTYDASIAKRVGELAPTTAALREWESTAESLTELQQLLSDQTSDEELQALAAEEISSTTAQLDALSASLKSSLLPAHPFAHLPCLLELRPGAGGSEAALFAGDLLRMYQGFCRRHQLRLSTLKLETTEGVGRDDKVQEAILEVAGEGAYGQLRGEAGVHRVQRVPETESKGRTHTSAVAVLVLPSFPAHASDAPGGEASFADPASDYYVHPADVRTDVMRARGAGGQHVNTTDSAVRLTHVPTNTVVAMQDSRSQLQNRQKAWQVLRARIAQARREAREEELARLRRGVVGVARMGRGDKVRTYNWGQQRVTDHRSGVTLHHLDDVMAGGESLDAVMRSVRAWLVERELDALAADDEQGGAKEV